MKVSRLKQRETAELISFSCSRILKDLPNRCANTAELYSDLFRQHPAFLLPLWSSESSLLFALVDKQHMRQEIITRVQNDDQDRKLPQIEFGNIARTFQVSHLLHFKQFGVCQFSNVGSKCQKKKNKKKSGIKAGGTRSHLLS